jgi:hypothetical protein
VLIGTPLLLRALPRHSVGCVGFVALDGLLRVPDFRAGERTWQLLWAAAESVAPGGRLVIQTQHPEHYAVRAVQAQDRASSTEASSGPSEYRPAGASPSLGPGPETPRCRLSPSSAGRAAGISGLAVYPPASVSPPRGRISGAS